MKSSRTLLFAFALLVLPIALAGASGQTEAVSDDALIEVDLAIDEHPAQPVKQDAPSRLMIEELHNIRLNIVAIPDQDYDAKLSLWLATDQVPDIATVERTLIRDYAGSGVLLPQTPLIEAHAPHIAQYLEDTPGAEKLRINGEYYFVPTQYINRNVLASYPMIRSDRLDELGLDAPTDFEELYDVLLAFKAAYPENLIWTNRNGTARLLSLIAYPMGSGWRMYFDKDVDGGTWLYGPVHEEFEYVLEYLARAYADGLLDPDFAITSADQWHEKNSSDRGMWVWENMSFGTRWNAALAEVDPAYEWSPVPVLEGTKGARMTSYQGLGNGYGIGGNTEYAERIIKLMDWMITPEGLDVTNWGIEGEHYRYKPGTGRPEEFSDYRLETMERELDAANKELLSDVWSVYAEKTDPYRSFQSDTGTGLLDFVMLTDSGVEYLWDAPGAVDAWYEMTANDSALHPRYVEPPLTEEEAQRVKDITTDVENILTPAYDNVIIGRMTMSEYRAEVERAIAAGALELEEIYNAAEARTRQ